MRQIKFKILPVLTAIVGLGAAGLALAQEQGRVLSSTPVMRQVSVQRQVCATDQTNCTIQTFVENKASAFNVVYEYNGKQYSVQMDNDPGPFVQLQVTPVAAGAASTVPGYISQASGGTLASQPAVVYANPAVVYAPAAPYYPPYYYGSPYYYGPAIGIGIGLGFGYYRGFGGGGRHRGR